MCGVVGVFNTSDPYSQIIAMLDGIPHRGENGAGIALAGLKKDFFWERSEYAVPELVRNTVSRDFSDYFAGIGHLRYGTTGDRRSSNEAQPLRAELPCGEIYLANNGDSPFANEDRDSLVSKGQILWTSSDTEIILQNMAVFGGSNLIEALKHGLRSYRGTYAVIFLVRDIDGMVKLIAARDKYGNRPLKLGKLDKGYAVASEDIAFDKIGAECIRDIAPGEMLIISEDGLQVERIYENSFGPLYQCVYELVYFSSPTSEIFGVEVDRFREVLGSRLASQHGHLVRPEDIVTFIPDSAKFYGEGFCDALDHKLDTLILRTHATRSFIQDKQTVREDSIRRKLDFMKHKIKEILRRNPFARFWFIDDSIVRGSVSRKIIRAFKRIANKILRGMGYTHDPWIGWLSAAPALVGPCHKGIDMPGQEGKLIAPEFLTKEQFVVDAEAMAKELNCNYVGYSRLFDLYETVELLGKRTDDHCFGCFENRDPIWGKW